ncbi:hypothetical protein B296_00000274 [Ensete ventricosum]|uniref:Uncharacterized protein n=1 Tax=Ensete ventricosum TaxID=4639 RepID=A0A426ZNY9_ENSVE|nr:hypothetical protein B296_00000274 [Ensete ventricosum]
MQEVLLEKSKKSTQTWSKSLIVLVTSGIVPSSLSPLSPTPLSRSLLCLLVEHSYINPKSLAFGYLDEKPIDTSLMKFLGLCPSTLFWYLEFASAFSTSSAPFTTNALPLLEQGNDDFTEVPPLWYHNAAKPMARLSVALHLRLPNTTLPPQLNHLSYSVKCISESPMDVYFYVKEKVLMLCGAEFRSHLGMATNTPSLRNTSHFSWSHLSPSTPLVLVANVEP